MLTVVMFAFSVINVKRKPRLSTASVPLFVKAALKMLAGRLAVVAAILRLLCLDCTTISGDHGLLRCEDLPIYRRNGGSELGSRNIAASRLVVGVLAIKGEQETFAKWTGTFET